MRPNQIVIPSIFKRKVTTNIAKHPITSIRHTFTARRWACSLTGGLLGVSGSDTTHRTLEAHMTKMTEKYNQPFLLEQMNKFEPSDIVMACPDAPADEIAAMESISTIPSLAVKIDDPLRIRAANKTFKSKRVSKFFEDEILLPQTSKTSDQKFLRHPPKCKSYTAVNVINFLMQIPNTFSRDEFRIQRSRIASIMNSYYPPFLRSSKKDRDEIQQITESRLNEALDFLRKIDFLDLELEEISGKKVEVIVGSRKKGTKSIEELTKYLKKKEARVRFQEQEKKRKEEEKQARKQKRKEERELKKKLAKEKKEKEKLERQQKGQMSLAEIFGWKE